MLQKFSKPLRQWNSKAQGIWLTNGRFYPTPGHDNHSIQDVVSGKFVPLNVYHLWHGLKSKQKGLLERHLKTFRDSIEDKESLACLLGEHNSLFSLPRIVDVLAPICSQNYPENFHDVPSK